MGSGDGSLNGTFHELAMKNGGLSENGLHNWRYTNHAQTHKRTEMDSKSW